MAIELDTSSIRERISRMQLAAYSNMGVTVDEISARFEASYQASAVITQEFPDYLSSSVKQPHGLPYQDPLLHSWITAVWNYHYPRVYPRNDPIGSSLILASAPTGQINALALSDSNEQAIMIEDGLLHFTRQFADLISPLLYTYTSDQLHYVTLDAELDVMIDGQPKLIDNLLDLALDYLSLGYVQSSGYQLNAPIHPASGPIFHGFISFVIEHELHHLLARPSGKHILSNIDESFENLWKLFESEVIPNVSSPVSRTEVRQIFEDHEEELLADWRAISLVFKQARADQSVFPTMDGVIMFFHVAELIRWLRLSVEDIERRDLESKLDGEWLSISAILYGDTHPVPYARRAGTLWLIRHHNIALADIYIERDERFAKLFLAIKNAYQERIRQGWQLALSVSPKWHIDEKELLGA